MDFGQIDMKQFGIEGCMDQRENLEFYNMQKTPADYCPEKIKERIIAVLSEGGFEEERDGSRRYLCTFPLAGYGRRLYCVAPLIVYAVFFGWKEELKELLKNRFVLSKDMSLLFEKRNMSGQIVELPPKVEELDICRLLLNMQMEPELLFQCMERIDSQRTDHEYALICFSEIFFADNEAQEVRDSHLKMRRPLPGKKSVLSENILFLHERAPKWFYGTKERKAKEEEEAPERQVDMEFLLDAAQTFMEIHKGQAKRQESVMRDVKNYVEHLSRTSGRAPKVNWMSAEACFLKRMEQMGQFLEALKAVCVTQRCKERYQEIWLLWILLFFQHFEYCHSASRTVRSALQEQIQRAKKDGLKELKKYFRNDIGRSCLNVAESGRLLQMVRLYRMIFDEKMVLDIHRERKTVTEILKAYWQLSESFTEERNSFCRFLENVEFQRDAANGTSNLAVLGEIIKTGSEELIRSCMKCNLIDSAYAGRSAEYLMLQDPCFRKNIPLLLLKKYEMI